MVDGGPQSKFGIKCKLNMGKVLDSNEATN